MRSVQTAGVGEYAACQRCSLHPLCVPTPLTRGDVEILGRLLRRRRVIDRGELVFRTGDPCSGFYAICAGSVKTSVVGRDGRLQVVGFHIAGELIGPSGACLEQHECDATALERTEICEIPLGRLREIAEQSVSLRRALFHFLGSEIAERQEQLLPFIGRKTAASRLAAYLLSLSDRFARRGHAGREFMLPMSRTDIGNYLGLAKETVSRLFARFEQEGLIRMRSRLLLIVDRERLQGVAGELPVSGRPVDRVQ
ncbi:transcriptional regulator [Sulfurifustis variabilis]|uniref:Transcriptional regulator n=1 Tax=Sulfurifustis variabilis TaxID=1675686 RepID=A0A1B4VE02_9GAMM|nr:helix-turn-helix domain-containing protein [Sulfurifustis variabilis]BAU48817.1 transcriptional regulator [Sulfurifustis variabilis]